MRLAHRGALALLLAVVTLTGAVGPAVAAIDGTARQASTERPQTVEDGASDVVLVQEFSLTPSTPGEVTVELRFSVPDRVRSLRTTVPDEATVTDASDFREGSGRDYHWNDSVADPTLTYTLPVNESLNVTGPKGVAGDHVAVDAGEWALFQRPRTPTHWNYTGDTVGFERHETTAGPGATGDWLVYLGDHEEYERSAHDQRFRLVVPSNANMSADPTTVLGSMADASDALRVGDRDETVFVVAAPTGDVGWAVRGLQTGESDLWVRDVEPVASADNAWVHEYVHTRQQFSLAPEMRWFREASASYYAALLTFEQRRIGYEAFGDRIGSGSNGSYADVVLANRSTWQASPQYDKGSLVAGQLDRRIRNASDRNRSLQTVFRALNERPGRTSLSDFLGHLGEYGDDGVVTDGERYAETAANVSMWNRTAHVRAFGTLPPRIGYQLSGDDGTYRVDGPYRNATIGDDEPLVVVPGERLRVNATVDNAGGRTGNYTATLAANGTVVDRANGTVSPNETATAELAHTFAEAGTYELGLGGDNVTVRVREPAEASVTDLTAASDTVRSGQSVEVSALVRNDAALPGEATVVFRRNDVRYATRHVTVGPESTVRTNVTVLATAVGTTVVDVEGSHPVFVSVLEESTRSVDANGSGANGTRSSPATTEPTAGATTGPGGTDRERAPGASGPGFGVVTFGLAATLAVVSALLRERH